MDRLKWIYGICSKYYPSGRSGTLLAGFAVTARIPQYQIMSNLRTPGRSLNRLSLDMSLVSSADSTHSIALTRLQIHCTTEEQLMEIETTQQGTNAMTTTDDYQLLMTTEQCAPAIEVTPPHGSNGSVTGSYSCMNFLLMQATVGLRVGHGMHVGVVLSG